MSTRRAHVLLPDDLLQEIDALVGSRGRSAFLVETARSEVRRQKLLRFLANHEPAWKDRDHPELKAGSAAWVRRLRGGFSELPSDGGPRTLIGTRKFVPRSLLRFFPLLQNLEQKHSSRNCHVNRVAITLHRDSHCEIANRAKMPG